MLRQLSRTTPGGVHVHPEDYRTRLSRLVLAQGLSLEPAEERLKLTKKIRMLAQNCELDCGQLFDLRDYGDSTAPPPRVTLTVGRFLMATACGVPWKHLFGGKPTPMWDVQSVGEA